MTTAGDIARLVSEVPLGGHTDQERAVAAALRGLLLGAQQRGVVLADEVGFGKTYEALAVASHLCAHAQRQGRTFERVLVLCKPSLTSKWEEESSRTHEGRGFPRYLPPEHPAQLLFGTGVCCIDSRSTARDMRSGGLRAQRTEGGLQVPPGLYIVNEKLLQREKREQSTLLKQLWASRWDVVIVDEAHHYARGNKPQLLFAPDGDIRNYDQPGLLFDKILALTATPFELRPQELVNLLALVRADPATLGTIATGLGHFVGALDRFFGLRERSPTDPLRREHVALLRRLRDEDALNDGGSGRGLQELLRRFLIRNTKQQNERRYFLVERRPDGFGTLEFRKLEENLPLRVRESPLISFEGEHTLFYLELRGVIQEVTERAREGETKRTFIPTDLRQGLSSYPQIAASKLLTQDTPSVGRIRGLVEGWNRTGRLHPKVAALREVVRTIVRTEIRRVEATADAWFSKILIFNKLIRGTAPQLAKVLGVLLEEEFGRVLDGRVLASGMTKKELVQRVHAAVDAQLDSAERMMREEAVSANGLHVPHEFEHNAFERHRGKPMLRVFRNPLRSRAVQPLALIDLLRSTPLLDDGSIATWVDQRITGRAIRAVRAVIERNLKNTPGDGPLLPDRLERAERELLVELEEAKSLGVVGRFDGDNSQDREAHRRNFNRRYNPFVLLVGQVGEEGIDLQEQCRYVIHYDLEWNPARMEQREGRVDRMGWMGDRQDDADFIDVRFLLLKGTYEERIFHTVMERDQWFQVLIGSKKRELGIIPEDADTEVAQDEMEEGASIGALTAQEKAYVMLDLRPE